MKLHWLSLLLVLLAVNRSDAQAVFYQPDTTVKVTAYGQAMTLAWAGGFNNPQFAMCDLNHDGKKDLVIYESYSSLKTFINVGTAGTPDYRYAPGYALTFPPIYSYLIMADYNGDGVEDLFDRGGYGYSVYKGFYNWAGQLCFTFYKDLFYFNGPSGPSNAYVEPGDRPSIVDVDNDGDLDFISYYIAGGNMYYYKNLRVENGLPPDSIHIALKDKCWGKVYQGFYRTHTLGFSCNNSGLKPAGSGEKKTHSGNTPCLFDWDMDGDYDYLDGSVSYPEITFLKNGRIEHPGSLDSMVSQDTTWQSSGKMFQMAIWPAAYNVDIDQDGKKDILIAPNSASGSENYKCIWYYKNYSTTGAPDWRFQSDSFLTDKSIDLGTAAYPVLFDYNKDSKLDLIIGSDGYRQPSGTLRSRLSLYLNTSTPGNGSFALASTNFLAIDAYNMGGAAPAIGDIDDDGLSDLILGHTDGTLTYFKNIAASESVQPVWSLIDTLRDMYGVAINVDGNAAPFIYDIDKDGKKDLIIGSIYGTIRYYRNVATTPGSIKLLLINSSLGHVKADPAQVIGNFSTPFIGKIDSSGNDYLLMGSNSGHIYQYTGFQSGDTTATYTLLDDAYSYIDTTYNAYTSPSAYYGIYGNLRTSVTVGDIDNSGKLSMIVGNVKGGVEFYKRKLYTASVPTVSNTLHDVLVYPNPANGVLNISWDNHFGTDVQVALFNMEGKQLYLGSISSSANHTTIPVDNLANGIYICTVQSGAERHYSKFTIIR